MRAIQCLFVVCIGFLSFGGLCSTDEAIVQTSNAIKKDLGNIPSNRDQGKMNLNIDEKTAVKIAEVILSSIYGETVLTQRPWIITDNGTDFKIVGTFHSKGRSMKGGVAEIIISKADARVVKYTHGK